MRLGSSNHPTTSHVQPDVVTFTASPARSPLPAARAGEGAAAAGPPSEPSVAAVSLILASPRNIGLLEAMSAAFADLRALKRRFEPGDQIAGDQPQGHELPSALEEGAGRVRLLPAHGRSALHGVTWRAAHSSGEAVR